MAIVGLIALAIVLLSFGQLRNLVVKYLIAPNSRFVLWASGFKFEYPPVEMFPIHQVMYTFNHNSYHDIFMLTGIGIPNLRFVLSEKTWVYIPLVISALAAGTRYIPQKKHAKRRLKWFKDTTSFLKRTNYSIAASSEGVHKQFHGIAPFNRGIYHMALEAGIPIVPLFINIPEENNVFQTGYAKSGTVKLELLPEISTANWKLEQLDQHIASVRKIYVDRFNELNPEKPTT
jgi:1-acyl-sn-glycerol-3-phosphate acyltransferase